MAIEYAGYIPPERVDWTKLSDDLAGKIYKIGEERTQQKEALDQIARDNEKMLNEWKPGKNQTLNEMVLRGAAQGRLQIKDWNDRLKRGEISPVDYKNKMNNLKSNWAVSAQTAQTYDQRITDIMARQQPNEDGKVVGSAYELELLRQFGIMSDLANMTYQFDDDGNIYMTGTDPKTGKITGNIYDVRTMGMPDNIVSNKVFVDETVSEYTKNWEPFSTSIENGRVTITEESVRNNDQYKMMVQNVVNTIAPSGNPRAQLSVLIDNGVITPDFYKTEEEYKQNKNEAIERLIQTKRNAGIQDINPTKEELEQIENSLVFQRQDASGVFNPVLTDKQQKLVRDRIEQAVGIQLSNKYQRTVASLGGGGGAPSGGGKTPKPVDTTKYEMIVNAWRDRDLTQLENLLQDDKYKIGTVKGKGRYIYVLDENGKPKRISPVTNNASDLKQFFFGTSADQLEEANRQINAYREKNKTTSNTTIGAGDAIF